MPLTLLLAIVVLGIFGIALLLHLLGNSKRFLIADVDQIRELWGRQYPNGFVTWVNIADGGHQALVETADGPGVVWAMGADVACRLVISDIEIKDNSKGLKIHLGDYSAPVVQVSLRDPAQRRHWVETLTGA